MFQIRILNAKDGTPHHLPLNNIISWDTELNNEDVYIPCARMTTSRLMIFASTYMTNVLIVWDWKAGGVVRVIIFGRLRLSFLSPLQVLKRSSVEDAFLCYRYLEFDFLDEFRLLTLAAPSKDDLVVFDTSVPQRSPDSWRQLNIDLPYRYLSDRSPSYAWKLSIHTDTDRSRGEGSCDGPFIIDPTRSIVVIARTRHGDFPIGEQFSSSRLHPYLGICPQLAPACPSPGTNGREMSWSWKSPVIFPTSGLSSMGPVSC